MAKCQIRFHPVLFSFCVCVGWSWLNVGTLFMYRPPVSWDHTCILQIEADITLNILQDSSIDSYMSEKHIGPSVGGAMESWVFKGRSKDSQ